METTPDSSITSTLQDLLTQLQHLSISNTSRTDLPTLPTEDTLNHARQNLPSSLPDTAHKDLSTHLLHTLLPALPHSSLSPNYYGFVTGGSTPPALYADILTSIYDQNIQVHLPDQSIATEVEVCALNMLLDLFDLDRKEWGTGKGNRGNATFTTGATASNVLGLAMGREWVLSRKVQEKAGGVSSVGNYGIYDTMQTAGIKALKVLSTMPHSSIAKAASIVGIGRANVVDVSRKEEDGLGIDFGLLEREVSKEDVATILVISAGEVNTGRFATNGLDEMTKIRQLCDKHNVWIHLDGAFGLFGRILPSETEEFSQIIRGCQGFELVDSITGDGHKLLNVPYDCGFYFCRHRSIAEDVFRNGNAAYLASAANSEDGISSPLNIGIENSRRFRALPVYATLLAYGREGYSDMLKRQIRLARKVVAELLWDSEVYQPLPQAKTKAEMVEKTFIVVLFRARNEELSAQLVRRINKTRRIYVSGTVWDRRPAVRIAIANWNVDVERDYEVIQGVLEEVAR